MNFSPPIYYERELVELLAEANNLLSDMPCRTTTLAGVYLDAAARVHYGLCKRSCVAVLEASLMNSCFSLTAREEYENLFAHRDRWETGTAFWLDGKLGSNKARKEWRVTALCLMAAIAAEEEGTI